jgi:hypothetical protein
VFCNEIPIFMRHFCYSISEEYGPIGHILDEVILANEI